MSNPRKSHIKIQNARISHIARMARLPTRKLRKKKKKQCCQNAEQTSREAILATRVNAFNLAGKTRFYYKDCSQITCYNCEKRGIIRINIPSLGKKMLYQKTSNSLSDLCVSD